MYQASPLVIRTKSVLLGHGALEHICVHAAERLEKPGAYWKMSSVAVSRVPRVMFQGPWLEKLSGSSWLKKLSGSY